MHPVEHAKSAAAKWGGDYTEYLKYEQWLDETKAWVGESLHRMFRHHSEGIFEMEKLFGVSFVNSVGKTVYTRYIGELHLKEDLDGYIPSARDWVNALKKGERPDWMRKTQTITFKGTINGNKDK